MYSLFAKGYGSGVVAANFAAWSVCVCVCVCVCVWGRQKAVWSFLHRFHSNISKTTTATANILGPCVRRARESKNTVAKYAADVEEKLPIYSLEKIQRCKILFSCRTGFVLRKQIF
jgi:hypothetical protein